jgi:hypothetical protein
LREQPLLFCLKCHNSPLPEFILHKLFPLKRQHFANRKGGILFLMKVSLPCQHINNEQRLNTQQDIKFSCKWSLFMLHSSQRTTACDAVSYWVTSPMKHWNYEYVTDKILCEMALTFLHTILKIIFTSEIGSYILPK